MEFWPYYAGFHYENQVFYPDTFSLHHASYMQNNRVITVEFGSMLTDAIDYAKDAIWGKWARWLLLIVSMIVFPLILGYTMEVYRGKKPAPELEHWGRLFVDGLKLLAASLIYAIPVLIIIFLTIGAAMVPFIPFFSSGDYDLSLVAPEAIMAAAATFIIGLIIAIIVGIIVTLISTIGIVRMARTERFGEAFNFGEILAHIRATRWWPYIAALIILWVVSIVFVVILEIILFIPYLGLIIWLFALPPFILFEARYISLVYDEGVPAEPVR
jgi:hypothetical protein